jgi:hypothetical protein
MDTKTISFNDLVTGAFDKRDTKLLTKLNLAAKNLELWNETFLGKVELPNQVQISVWATPTPALFFRFAFFFPESEKRYHAETGSGDFCRYWRTAKRFAKEKRDRKDPLFELREIVEQD